MNNPRIRWLSEEDPPDAFPPAEAATLEPNGLLAAGGDLSQPRLLHAYRHGIFPWYEEGQPVLWWSPDPRCIIRPGDFRLSRRMLRDVRRSLYRIRLNTAFADVVNHCRAPRRHQHGTWITPDMVDAFVSLHDARWAHSIEVWQDDRLVGGLYGLLIGQVFFGESMFSQRPNASKYALLYLDYLMRAGELDLLDCQVVSPHLLSLGARTCPRAEFVRLLSTLSAGAKPRRLAADAALNPADLLPK